MRAIRPMAVAFVAAACIYPAQALACGGCFGPPPGPTGMPSLVNAHRMALLVSPTGSVLWDQIQYTGAPQDFVWVLPVAGTPEVQVADNGFFEALSGGTQLTLQAPSPPPTTCPDPCAPYGASVGFGSYSTAFASDAASALPPVNVYHEGVVGPYDTATIGSTDPTALVTWLQDHGYQIPDSILPTIQYYVAMGMNFVALRLAPTAGIDRMQPVRVPMDGLALTIPLRMVAAGVGTTVDLELFVFAESRMQTANFPNAEVDRTSITYDWATNTFDYDARFNEALFAGTGPLTNWVTEYAQSLAGYPIYQLTNYQSGSGSDMHSARADMEIVTNAIAEPYLTRLRTRLPPSQLATDLTLSMSSGETVGQFVNVTRELNRPAGPVCNTYCTTGSGLDPGGSTVRGSGSSLRCATGVAPGSTSTALVVLALGSIFLARRRRSCSAS